MYRLSESLKDTNLAIYIEPLETLGVHEIEDIALLEESDFVKLKIKPVHKKKLLKLAFSMFFFSREFIKFNSLSCL